VLIIGSGAVGNEVGKNLTMLGVTKIYWVDFDIVEISNLNRCIFFRPQDCRKKTFKVMAVKREVEAHFPDSVIYAYPVPIEEAPEEIWQVPLVIICVDNDYARYYINAKIMSLTHRPFVVNGAMGKDFYCVQILYPQTTACLCCLWTQEYKKQVIGDHVREKCDQFFATTVEKFPTISVITSLVGGIMATEAIKILAGLQRYQETQTWLPDLEPHIGKYLHYDIRSHQSVVADILRNPKCIEPLCSMRE
jgi:adenylyltransferase/sulfurtransferase